MMYGGFVRRFSGDRLGLAPPSVRSSAAVSLVGVLVLLGIGVVLARPARAMAPVATAKPVVLAVWAHVDDNMPVAGATVRVYATARSPASGSGQPPARLLVRQSSAPRTERTYGTGVALLEFTHLPRAFTVEVTGGQAGGRRLPGRFSVVVRNYLSGTVVDVNPVTTLITDDLAGQRELPAPIALARDHAQIYRLLGIPGWEDQVDLRYSTRYFDGASYLRAAQRAGGIRRLDRQLVAQARRGQQHRFLSAPATFTEGPRLAGPIASAAAAGAGLIAQAFKFLAAQAGSSLVRVAGQKAGTAALGWVLAAYGFEDALADQEVTEIRRIVEQLSTQVAQLQNQVSQLQRDLGVIGFSTLAHQTDRTIGQIDHATSQLALLANMPAKDSTKAAFAQTIADYIGTNLLDAPAILNRGLGSHLPLADNVIKSASRALAQRKFFGPQSSAEVRGVYDYFAAYQVQLAMLLQEYYHAKPTVYSAENNVANLAQLRGNVESQAGSLKPDVPADTVIDTKSSEMWVTDLPDPREASLRHCLRDLRLSVAPQQLWHLYQGLRPSTLGRPSRACRSSSLRLGNAHRGRLSAADRRLERQVTFSLATQGGRLQRTDHVGLRLPEVGSRQLQDYLAVFQHERGFRRHVRSLPRQVRLTPSNLESAGAMAAGVRTRTCGTDVRAQAEAGRELLVVGLAILA